MIAAQEGHPTVVELLLTTAGALVNAQNVNGLTALHLAAGKGRTESKMELVPYSERHSKTLSIV